MKTRDYKGKMKWLRLGIASLALAAGVFFSNGLTARAEENVPQNTTKETATPIALGEEVQTLSDYSHSQYFKFQTTEPGYLTVHYQHEAGESTGNIYSQRISILNNNLNEYFYCANSKPEDTTAMVSPKVGVTPDTYYFFISGYQGPACKVTFKVDFTPCDNYEQEINDKPAKAESLPFDKTMYAWILNTNYDKDYYRFDVETPSTITLDINHESKEKSKWVVTIWDSNEKKIYETTFEGGQTRLDTITDLDLEPGTYYVCVGGDESRRIQGKTYDITAHCDSSARAQVRAFVSRLYRVALNRNPDPDGLTDWTNRLINGDAQAVNIVQGILGSNEYANMGKSNGEIVNDCYRAMLGRDAEEEGYNHWLVRLDNGMSMNAIFAGFVGSDEFKNLCAT
nr:DUF4214 domain-containing protein [Lachnospiraceae bacterium]